MRKMILRNRTRLAVAIVALAFGAPVSVHAQVVVIANGSPVTEYDIQQRLKLDTISQKSPNRQQVINELIDDRLKIARAKVYGQLGQCPSRNRARWRQADIDSSHPTIECSRVRVCFDEKSARTHVRGDAGRPRQQ